jgi:hypothetical protein
MEEFVDYFITGGKAGLADGLLDGVGALPLGLEHSLVDLLVALWQLNVGIVPHLLAQSFGQLILVILEPKVLADSHLLKEGTGEVSHRVVGRETVAEVEVDGEGLEKAEEGVEAQAFDVLVVDLLDELQESGLVLLEVLLLAETDEVYLGYVVAFLVEIVLLAHLAGAVAVEQLLEEGEVPFEDQPHRFAVPVFFLVEVDCLGEVILLQQLLVDFVFGEEHLGHHVLFASSGALLQIPLLQLLLDLVLQHFLAPSDLLLLLCPLLLLLFLAQLGPQ